MIKHISLGENCIIQKLLQIYGLSSDNGIFSSVYCDIELINSILDDKFLNFLNQDYYEYVMIGNKKCLANRFYVNEKGQHIIFPHHQIFTNKNHKESLIRKIHRFKEDIERGGIVFWYNYRYNETNNIEYLLSHFKKFDKRVGGKNEYIILNQKINQENEGFNHLKIDNFNIIECFDKNIWHGDSNYDGRTFRKQFDLIINDCTILKSIIDNVK
jgi:hypothetical protein